MSMVAKTLLTVALLLVLKDCFGNDDQDQYKIVRDPSTNNCAVIGITAMDPGKPEQLGTYKTQQDAINALNVFKNTPDSKPGYEKCM